MALLPIAPVNAAPEKVKIGIVYDVGGRGERAADRREGLEGNEF